MSIYDVFSGGSRAFNKEEWAAQKQEQRKEAQEELEYPCGGRLWGWWYYNDKSSKDRINQRFLADLVLQENAFVRGIYRWDGAVFNWKYDCPALI